MASRVITLSTIFATIILPRFSAKADALIREIHEYLTRERMWDLFDWFNPPSLSEFERELQIKRDELRREAKQRGWEKK